MKYLILLSCAMALACASNDDNGEWDNFKRQYGKLYQNEAEEDQRMSTFYHNKRLVDAHNVLYSQGRATYTKGINQFSDMLYKEFSSKVLMTSRTAEATPLSGKPFQTPANFAAPDSVDWRTSGYVTPVKDQGQCGSCWSFSATGGLEGQHFAKSGQLISLSEQNLVDCTGSYGNAGCDGGYIERSFQYVIDQGGIDTENSYPYEGYVDTCRYNSANLGSTCATYTDLPRGDEISLMNAVASVGPVSGCFYASNSFQQYSGGIYYGNDCPSGQTNHCILIVGYGTEDGTDFWIVKNSWGASWGEQGYVRMTRNQGNNCNIASDAHYPAV